MEDSELEKYKLATLEVLKSLGGIASDTRFLHDSVFLSLDDVPPEDPDYDYDGRGLCEKPGKPSKRRESLTRCGSPRARDAIVERREG